MTPFSLNIRDKLHSFDRPQVMAIVNVTPDSFFEGSRTFDVDAIRVRAHQIITEGADMIDIGAYSSRSGACDITPDEECERLCRGIETLRAEGCTLPLSVDTFRAKVAEEAIRMGADLINDIGGGTLDAEMFETVTRLRVPYILMHMRGTPSTMGAHCQYNDVCADVCEQLARSLSQLNQLGVSDVIVDPGFGFAKNLTQNYELMHHLPDICRLLQRPLLVGISRKSMLSELLNISTDEALNATTALNAMALDRGASIIRVHDVLAAKQAVKIYQAISTA